MVYLYKPWWAWLAVISGLALVALVCRRGGEGQFSPDSFEHRAVRLYYHPKDDWVVLSIPGRPYRKKIVQFWTDEGYFTDAPEGPKRWDTIIGWESWRRHSS